MLDDEIPFQHSPLIFHTVTLTEEGHCFQAVSDTRGFATSKPWTVSHYIKKTVRPRTQVPAQRRLNEPKMSGFALARAQATAPKSECTFFSPGPTPALRCKLPPIHCKPPKTSKNTKTAASHPTSTLPPAQSRPTLQIATRGNSQGHPYQLDLVSPRSHLHHGCGQAHSQICYGIVAPALSIRKLALSSRLLLTCISHALGQAHHRKA